MSDDLRESALFSRPAPGLLAWRWAYRHLAYPALRGAFSAAAPFNAKIRRGLAMRAPGPGGLPPWMRVPAGLCPIWLHCASGELEYAKPVIRAIKEAWPSQAVMVTYFSPSAEVPVAAFPGIDFAAPAPWDKPRPLAQMIARARPRALLIARTDAWPEMVEQARIAGVPSLLFSATLTSSSGRSAAWARPAALLSLDPLAQIFCVGESDREAFAKLGYAAKTRVAGDTRYDQVLARLASPKPIRDELFKAQQPTLIAGSTWPEDERELFVAAQALRGRVRFCLVPHEPTPDRMRQLQALASAAGFASALYSEASDWPDGAVLLVDRVGVLAELYAKGRFAFVGGSFRKTVHSVMEPLASGARTFIGPLYANNREAAEFQGVIAAGLPAVRACASGADLAGAVGDAMGASEAESRAAIRGAVQARAGQGTGAVLEWIRRAIEQRRSLP